jgi:hypothetical protein
VKKEFVNKLGEEKGTAFYHFASEVLRLASLWTEFKLLFSSSEKANEILNNSVPSLFAMIRQSMIRDIVTSIRKLYDPRGSPGKRNLCLETIVNMFSDDIEVPFLTNEKEKLSDDLELLKLFRNKIYSHNSYEFLVEGKIKIESFDKELLDRVVDSLKMSYSSMHKSLFNSSVIYVALSRGDSIELLRKLERANRYEEVYFKELEERRDFDPDFYVVKLKSDK